MRVFMAVVGLSCLGLAGLGFIVQFHPAGPSGTVARVVQAAVMVSAAAVGVRWLRGPWPTFGQAVAFVVWANAAVAATAITMSTPSARLCATPYLGLIGVYVGFILGVRVLRAHCAFGALLIGGISAWAVAFEHRSLFGLFIYFMPALTWVVVIPLAGSVLIELGRRAIVRTVRSAHRDALTGLRNRRGMHAAVGTVLARDAPVVVVTAVCDIDRFKQLNDDGGHALGDAALVALADRLQSVALAGEITGRIGGDELVLVAFLDDLDVVPQLVDRLTPLTRVQTAGAEFTVSIGVAAMSSSAQHFAVDDVVRHADSAMYDAKRAGGGACVVYRPEVTESTTDATAGRSRPGRPA